MYIYIYIGVRVPIERDEGAAEEGLGPPLLFLRRGYPSSLTFFLPGQRVTSPSSESRFLRLALLLPETCHKNAANRKGGFIERELSRNPRLDLSPARNRL